MGRKIVFRKERYCTTNCYKKKGNKAWTRASKVDRAPYLNFEQSLSDKILNIR